MTAKLRNVGTRMALTTTSTLALLSTQSNRFVGGNMSGRGRGAVYLLIGDLDDVYTVTEDGILGGRRTLIVATFDETDQAVIGEYLSPLMPASQRHEGNDLAAENVRARHFDGAVRIDRCGHFEDMLRAGWADGDDHDAAWP
jgi:hypothetical protein